MITLKNIHALSDFLRNAKSHMARLKKTGEHEVLTVNGTAEAVVISADAYEKLIEEMEVLKTLNIVHQSALESFRAGEISADELRRELRPQPQMAGIPVDRAFAELERKIQLRRKKKAS